MIQTYPNLPNSINSKMCQDVPPVLLQFHVQLLADVVGRQAAHPYPELWREAAQAASGLSGALGEDGHHGVEHGLQNLGWSWVVG